MHTRIYTKWNHLRWEGETETANEPEGESTVHTMKRPIDNKKNIESIGRNKTSSGTEVTNLVISTVPFENGSFFSTKHLNTDECGSRTQYEDR